MYESSTFRTNHKGRSIGTYGNQILNIGDIVEVRVSDNQSTSNRIMHPCRNRSSRTPFFTVGAILGIQDRTPWVFVKEMKHIDGFTYQAEKITYD